MKKSKINILEEEKNQLKHNLNTINESQNKLVNENKKLQEDLEKEKIKLSEANEKIKYFEEISQNFATVEIDEIKTSKYFISFWFKAMLIN